MPGLHLEGTATAVGSPVRKNRLSLRFLQKKETKRALDFTEPQAEEPNNADTGDITSCDQVVPAPCPSSLPCGKRESLVPFVGLNNLGNTCYLNSILQVLYYCPGFKETIKSLYQLSKLKDKQKDDAGKSEEQGDPCEGSIPAHMELLHSFYSLITSVEQLQSSFLFNPEKYSEGELATPPRRILSTLRQLNPMYEGYLQHDAQEVLQCLLAYIQEACDSIKKELTSNLDTEKTADSVPPTVDGLTTQEGEESSDGQPGGKRKSDTEAGNAKKKPKSQSKPKKSDEESRPFTRSKRKSSSDIAGNCNQREQAEEDKQQEKEDGSNAEEEKNNAASKDTNKRKKRVKLSWLKSSEKQPSIFSKFRSIGRISSHVGDRVENKDDQVMSSSDSQRSPEQEKVAIKVERGEPTGKQTQTSTKNEELQPLDVLKQLFQGQLVLRTRCLECECYSERREDFQDISVPVQEDEPSCLESTPEISPDPKSEQKTLKWAISQFASVERIVGEDKYFCETCHHYTEAERSLLFDKTPDIVTIHLKCFAASGSEMDPYAGLSKVNTPLHTPLKLSLEEWSTRPSAPQEKHHYRLFAVVMHSGVTISSGHYTTYIRMTDLSHTNLKLESEEEGQQEEEGEIKPVKKEEASQSEYDDEVAFGVSTTMKSLTNSTSIASKAGGKRSTEGVGLLGGQRSISSFEISSSKQGGTDKAVSMAGCSPAPVKKEQDEEHGMKEERQVSFDSALQKLLDYEGMWMLFDDSEVRLFAEEDFLRACSPETTSSSTPYLLFYKKIAGDMT